LIVNRASYQIKRKGVTELIAMLSKVIGRR